MENNCQHGVLVHDCYYCSGGRGGTSITITDTAQPPTQFAEFPGKCVAFPDAGYPRSTGAPQRFCPDCGVEVRHLHEYDIYGNCIKPTCSALKWDNA